jgi:hypothetical protein
MNPERFRLPAGFSRSLASRGAPRPRSGERFLKGPVPWSWLRRAGELEGRGRALHVAIVVWFLAGIAKTRTVTMSGVPLREMGVDRWTAARELRRWSRRVSSPWSDTRVDARG